MPENFKTELLQLLSKYKATIRYDVWSESIGVETDDEYLIDIPCCNIIDEEVLKKEILKDNGKII